MGDGTGADIEKKIEEYGKTMTEVLIQLGRLNDKMDSMKDLSKELRAVETMAINTENKAQSAHHRLNNYDKHIFAVWVAVVGVIIKTIFFPL